MLRSLTARLMQSLFVMFGISVVCFLIFFATPGADPAARLAGRNASPETLAMVRKDFGFDRPLPEQYARMMTKLFLTRDLTSFMNRGYAVVPAVFKAIPVTLSIAVGAAVIWVLCGLFVGTVAAAWRGGIIDRILMLVALIGISVPIFWLGEVANLITQSRYHDTWMFSWVPPLGYVPLTVDPLGWFKCMVIPWITVATLNIGLYGRVLRASMIETMQEDFVRTARAKGIGRRRVLLRHVLRTSLTTFVTMFGLDFGILVGGAALLAEVVFGLQGVGKMTYDALKTLDLPIILACVMYSSMFVVIANFVVDIVYSLLDPRVRDAR